VTESEYLLGIIDACNACAEQVTAGQDPVKCMDRLKAALKALKPPE